jgi:hypothetical protein
MKKIDRDRVSLVLFFIIIFFALCLRAEEKKSLASQYFEIHKWFVKTMPDDALIAASSAVGAPGYHRHLVRPGLATSYMVRVLNTEESAVSVELDISEPPVGWSVELEKESLELGPGETVYVRLELVASPKVKPGKKATVKVSARTSSGKTGQIALEAETTEKHKIYYISIDSLDPRYLKLDSKGTGPGKEGDWLMPSIHAFLDEAVFYAHHKVHLVSATDMNHASYLSGAYPGRLGIYSVNVFFFGFDERGIAITKTTPIDLMFWGPEGRPVTTIFNVVKDPAYGGNPNAFSAYISGKEWVPEHYRNPVFGLDRIATINDYTDYITPPTHGHAPFDEIRMMILAQFAKMRNTDFFLWEDVYTADQAIEVINNEDPDVCYILLGAVDAAGHAYGSAYDLDEWDDRGTPEDLSDDRSRVNRRANRLGIIKTVRVADEQVGRILGFLKEHGVYDNSYIIVESDHSMETNFHKGPKLRKTLKDTGYSDKEDYFFFTAAQIGLLFLRPGQDNPEVVEDIERALEDYRMKNPLTGEVECPLIVLTRAEMKTGIDRAMGERVTLPGELYSEYYIEHPKEGNLQWPDLMAFTKQYYQFPIMGVGLANLGLGGLDIPIPAVTVYVGGHGAPSTQPALLSLKGPGIPTGVLSHNSSWSTDVAPTLYSLEGYKIPESVQGNKLEW